MSALFCYNSLMFLGNLRKFVRYFAGDRKKSIAAYLVMSYIASVLEVFGVAIIYPFILLILKPELSAKIPFHLSPFGLGAGVLGLFVLKNLYMLYCIKSQGRLIKDIETNLIKRFIHFFLNAPYHVTSTISRSDKERVVSLLVVESVNNFFVRFLNLNINLAIVVSIMLLLLIKFPIPTLITAILAALSIYVQNLISKKALKQTSEALWFQQKSYDNLKGAIMPNLKLIKLSNNEKGLYDKIEFNLDKLKKVQADYYTATTSQPYRLEPLVIILLFVMLSLIALFNGEDRTIMIASFAIAASAIFRILPALARVQTSLNGIIFGRRYVSELIDFYEKYCTKEYISVNKNFVTEFNESIKLENITFSYLNKSPVINNLNLTIYKNEFIGVIGESGAGKSTLIDIISGLLPVDSGRILIDGKEGINRSIGYVPQEPVFFNTSFRENVAFGNDYIDDNRVVEALSQAALYDFIEKHYSEGIYASPMVDTVGLSLGQKQRLSIARAIYNKPQILILDEATSALDLETEKAICKLLTKLKSNMTIIAVAHRLSTLADCDRIVFIKDGRVHAEGTFEELEKNCKEFQKLLEIQKLDSLS